MIDFSRFVEKYNTPSNCKCKVVGDDRAINYDNLAESHQQIAGWCLITSRRAGNWRGKMYR